MTVVSVLVTALVLLAACGEDTDEYMGNDPSNGGSGGAGGSADGGNSAGAGGSGGSAGSGGSENSGPRDASAGGSPLCTDCEPGEFCSFSGKCIAQGTCELSVDCAAGRTCVEAVCEIDDECGAQEFDLQQVAPNLLILLDRSCSMPDCSTYDLQLLTECGNLSNVDKWGIAVNAITALTELYDEQVRWGLKFFPDATGDNCVQDPPEVAPSDNNEEEIQQILANALDVEDSNFPIGPCVTNINAAMQHVSHEPSLQDPERRNFVLLITDGVEFGCLGNNANTVNIMTELALEGVHTFVVGFGGGVNPNVLNRFAVAGGSPNPEPNTDYYQADDLESLEDALGSIVGRIIGCDFQLDALPENTRDIYVWVDDEMSIERDDPDGWRYHADSNRVVFQGSACEHLKDGVYQDVDVVFGCNAPIIE